MKVWDLYAPDFPHGTRAGYNAGCRGSQCPEVLEGGMACRGVAMRYSGDYAFQTAIDGGMTSREFLAQERAAADAAAAAKSKRPKPAEISTPEPPAPTPAPEPEEPAMTFETFPAQRRPRIPLDLPHDHPDFPHGDVRGYARGCRCEPCREAKSKANGSRLRQTPKTSSTALTPAEDQEAAAVMGPAASTSSGEDSDSTQTSSAAARGTSPLELVAAMPAGEAFPFDDVVAHLEARAIALEAAAARDRAAVDALRS